MKNYVKEKKKKTFYAKWITPVLLLYGLFICLCFLAVLTVVLTVPLEHAELASSIGLPSALVMTLAGSGVMIFLVIPTLKKKQAGIDFARHNFEPYTPAETETFECEYRLLRYTLTASPFDENVIVEFQTDEQVKDYLAQHFAQEQLILEESFSSDDDSPFYIVLNAPDKKGVTVRIDKRTDGEKTTLYLTERDKVTFTNEGAYVGEKLYTYPELHGQVVAVFNKATDFHVLIMLVIFIGDDGYISFEMSSRIDEIVKRFNVSIENTDVLNYVLADPKHAFEQTAMQLGLRKLK